MILKLNDKDVVLQSGLELNDRKKIASNLIENHEDDFLFKGFLDYDRKVSVRLDILATYILRADKQDKDYLTTYKQKARNKTEKPASMFSPWKRSGLRLE